MLKKIFRILVGILLAGVMAFLVVFVIKSNKASSSSGTITVLINSMDDEIEDERRISFKEGDTLFEILSSEYELSYENTSYGHYITGISGNGFTVKTDGKSSWIWFELFYLKDGASYSDVIDFDDYLEQTVTTGIDGISLKDDMILALNERDGTHAASVLDSAFPAKTKTKNIFQIVVLSLMGAVFAGAILYAVMTRKKNEITVRELAVMAFMTVILFVQEELLSFLPNIQLTFCLIGVYVKVFGLKKTSLIVLVHVLLDNLLMGSLMPVVFIPMLAGYLIYILLVHLVRNKPLGFVVFAGILGSLVYCYMFMAVNALFLEVDMWAYFVADIPFEILLCLSSAFTLLYLYKPLSVKISELYDPINQYGTEDGEIV